MATWAPAAYTAGMSQTPDSAAGIGNRIAPARFVTFILIALIAGAGGTAWLGWRQGIMAGFDLGALIFIASVAPLMGREADAMRRAAKRNDANRAMLLAVTGAVMATVLVAVAAELAQPGGGPSRAVAALVIATLALAWLFSNLVYALHYAHLFYSADANGKDRGGITVPGSDEPDYWDFVYFAFTLGMTFQTSDVEIGSAAIRRVALFHCLVAFVFNLGVIAFTINVLGS